MRTYPFFGVCGLQDVDEYAKLVALANNMLPRKRFLMAGVKKPNSNLDKIELSDVVRPFIHCDYFDRQTFEDLITGRIEQSKRYAQGLQLNCVPWIETDFTNLWTSIQQQYPHLKLVLQVHSRIIKRYQPQEIAHHLQRQNIHYVMFDASQSRGIPYDPATMLKCIHAVYDLNLPIGVVVSGGLAPDSVKELFWPLIKLYPDLSCDAFLGLQNTFLGGLSWSAIERYLSALKRGVPS